MPDAEADGDMLQLEELEPSPIEDTPLEQKESYFPQAQDADTEDAPPSFLSAKSRRSTNLGLGSHSVPWYLNRVQKYSSYAFSVFAAMHITNTSLIPLLTQSVPASEPYLLLTRPYYQSPLAEPLVVIAPLVLHVGSGLALRLYRRRQELSMYGAEQRSDRRRITWPAVSGTSALGYALVPLLLGHTFINRLLPLLKQGGSSSVGLGYVAHGFAKHPAVSFVGFAALLGTGAAHFVWGAAKWWGLSPAQVVVSGPEARLRKKRRWWLLNGASVALAGLWAAGAFGVVGRAGAADGYIGREYDDLYRSIPVVGHWL